MVEGFVARLEFADGLKHLGRVDVVDFEALADRAEESDGQFAAEMLAEFFEAAEDDRLVFCVYVQQFVSEQFKTEHLEEADADLDVIRDSVEQRGCVVQVNGLGRVLPKVAGTPRKPRSGAVAALASIPRKMAHAAGRTRVEAFAKERKSMGTLTEAWTRGRERWTPRAVHVN